MLGSNKSGASYPTSAESTTIEIVCDNVMSQLVVPLSPLLAMLPEASGLALAMADDRHRRGRRDHLGFQAAR